MTSQLCLSVTFLAPRFHGRRDGDEREWPPSPLRMFQALVAAAAAGRRLAYLRTALQWLEEQSGPLIIAPNGEEGSGYRLSVPNNAMDVVTRAWARGNDTNKGDANPATHRTMKGVKSTRLVGNHEFPVVRYLWHLPAPVTDDVRAYLDDLSVAARRVVALGWGIDLVAGYGQVISRDEAVRFEGDRWQPTKGSTANRLRTPIKGTLEALERRHHAWLTRLSADGRAFTPVPPLTAFNVVGYRRATDSSSRAIAVFSIVKLDASGFHPYDPVRRTAAVAGMMRYTTKLAAARAGWPESKINTFVLGHGESKRDSEHAAVGPQRFAYLPLPSIEARGEGKARVVGSVRRTILSSFAENCEAEIAWARRALSGQEFIDESKKVPVALLSLIPETEKVVRPYLQPAALWATVTPVVLPGYDDPAHYRRRLKRGVSQDAQKQLLSRLGERIDGLLRKAIVQAGFSQVLAEHVDLEWRKVGFWSGVYPADRYHVPDHLQRFPRFHVKLCWRDSLKRPVQVPGPICLGGGRFYGFGLFAGL